MKKCCVCETIIENEDAPLLTMGAVGTPKLLCDSCAELLDTATMGREYEEIESAMEEIGKRMAEGNPDRTTYGNVSVIMAQAAARAKLIKSGEYDFALDEQTADDEDIPDEIPEELKETEEDRELDRQDEAKEEKFNRFFDYVTFGVFIAILLFVGWKLIDTFILK